MKRQLMAEQWDQFARAILPEGCSALQRQEMRRAFYAGGQALFYTMMRVVDPGTEPTDDDMKMMSGLEREMSDFAESIKAGRA